MLHRGPSTKSSFDQADAENNRIPPPMKGRMYAHSGTASMLEGTYVRVL
jgi:hypothetical protein